PYNAFFDANSKRIAVAVQDNGTSLQSAPGSRTFNPINSGDGVSVAINDRTVPGQSALYSSNDGLFNLSRLMLNAQGPGGPPPDPSDPNSNAGGVPVYCNGGHYCFDQIEGASVDFGAKFAVNRVDPSRIVFGGTKVYTTQDFTGTNGPGAASVDLTLIDLGATGGYYVSAMTYGAQNNVHALIAGTYNAQLYRSLTEGGPVTLLSNYAGAIPTSIVFDNRDSQRFFVADTVDLWSTTNGGAAAGSVTFNNLTSNLPTGFRRPSGVEFISSNGVNALLVGGLNVPLSCNPTPDGCVISSTQSPITVADSDSSGNLLNWRAF